MCIAYIALAIILTIIIYVVYTEMTVEKEGFYPRRWWWGPGSRWGWRRPYYGGWGNWRPYGYYPAYSGYWKQCPRTGTWCPGYMNCNSLACN